ncbi:MAG: hypothetical protein WDM81_01430 [Rhizomicrobium sp.]
MRGDTVDIFPAHYEDRAWRVELFGDVVDSITEFDPLTGRPAGTLDSIKIYANSHYVTPRPTLQQAPQRHQWPSSSPASPNSAPKESCSKPSAWNSAPISTSR